MFQSTHSLRSATAILFCSIARPPVSIHALLAECDPMDCPCTTKKQGFQSTHSLRSATLSGDSDPAVFKVSIHALLAECDPLTK